MGKAENSSDTGIQRAPSGWMLIFALGPGLMWAGEYIGSGEVILTTRAGAIFGIAVLWVPIVAIFTKFWIGLAGAHYTVMTGEGMIDMLGRTPGPKNWVIWPVFVGQLCSAVISTAALASAAGVFASYFIPLGEHSPVIFGWGAVFLIIALVWSGLFEPLKIVMSMLVTIIIIGTLAVAYRTWPGIGEAMHGLFGFTIPETPAWAPGGDEQVSPWVEMLPLLGWAAGGFASQVWYTYWVLGAGYGMAKDRDYGEPCDEDKLKSLEEEDIDKLRGWRRLVSMDATLALCVGILVTLAFLIAGAGVLGPKQIAPEGVEVALQLSELFSEQWGALGGHLFVLAGLAAMLSTMIGQFAGWPRLIADCARLTIPAVRDVAWKTQFRVCLVLIAVPNLVILYFSGKRPVWLVQTSAILDGLVLTPLQALAVGLVLFLVMPRMFKPELRAKVKAHPILGLGLASAFLLFGFVCVFKLSERLLG